MPSLIFYSSAYASLALADTAAAGAGGCLVVDDNHNLSAHLTLSAKQVSFAGGIITLGNYDLTASRQFFDVGPVQIIAVTGTGRLKGTMLNPCVFPEWLGAKGNGTSATATTNAIQYLEDFLYQSDLPNTPIEFTGSTYLLNATVVKPQSFACPCWRGKGGTVISYAGIGNHAPARRIKGGSGRLVRGPAAEGLTFTGDAATRAIQIEGQCGISIRDCIFKDNFIGVIFLNASPGEFTEYAVVEDSLFDSECKRAIHYEVLSGSTNSFHGTGLRNCQIREAEEETETKIVVGSGLPYNAPMDFQVWKYTSTPIISHEGAINAYWIGTITIENFSAATLTNPIEIANTAAKTVALLGDIASFGQQVWASNVRLLDRIQINSDGTISFFDKRTTRTYSLSAGINDVWFDLDDQEIWELNINVFGPNYTYALSGLLSRDRFSASGNWAGEVTSEDTDPGGIGPPVISLDPVSTKLRIDVPILATTAFITGRKRQVQRLHRPT